MDAETLPEAEDSLHTVSGVVTMKMRFALKLGMFSLHLTIVVSAAGHAAV